MTLHRQPDIDAAAQRAIKPYLEPGEVLLWAEKPPGLKLALPQLPMLIFQTAFVGLFAVVFLAEPRYREALMAIIGGDAPSEASAFDQFFAAFLLILVAAGIYGLIQGLKSFAASWRTFYGLTGKRVIILQTMPPSRIHSLGPSAFTTISRTENGRSGTIIFDEPEGNEQEKRGSGFKRLIAITNPAGVETLIVSTLRPADTQGRY